MLRLNLNNLFSTVDSSQLTTAELLSLFDQARELAKTAVSDCGDALIGAEQATLTPQQLHIISGNASTATSSTVSWRTGSLDQRYNNRLDSHAWLDLAHLSLAVCPPRLVGLTEADDPLGRKALSHKLGGGMIRRHNEAVQVVHTLETEAGRASRMEVTGLYADAKRVDTHAIMARTSKAESTDVRIVDPSTAARVRAGDTVEQTIRAAEREKDVKYNSPEDPAADGSVLSPLVFTPGGRIGPAAESFLNRLARERAGRFIPVDEQPSRSALTAIYRSYRRRLVHAISRGLALQLSIYALERRVGPASAAALRAAYPSFVTASPNTIGQHTTANRRSGNRARARARNLSQ